MTDTREFAEDMGLDPDRFGHGDRKAPDHPLIDRSRWGIFPDVDLVAYFGGKLVDSPAISQSGMKKLNAETPLDFAFEDVVLNPDAERIESTVAQRRGDVVHQLTLGKGQGYAVGDFKDWRTKDAQSFRDNAIADGLTPIKRAEFEEAEVVAEVMRDRIAEVLEGAEYQTEVAFLYQEMTPAGPVWVRGLMDVWCEERAIILDPKCTANIYDGKVDRHIVDMGWDLQGALYPHAVGMIRPELAGRVRFRDLMVKPKPPFTSRVVALEKYAEATAIWECRRAMEKFGECLYAGRWPGFEETYYATLPVYEAKRREALHTGGE